MKKLAPAHAGASFFIMIYVGIEKADPAKQGKKVSGGHFFRPWEIPRIPNAIRRIVGGSRTRTGHHAKKRTSSFLLYQKTDLPTAVRKALTGRGERIRIDKPTNVVCRYAENPGRTSLSCPDGEREPISGVAVL